MSPLSVLGLIAASAVIGVLAIRFAATGLTDPLRTSAVRILTPVSPQG
ncbi:hypothetical protein [Streptomyces zaomyceticus]